MYAITALSPSPCLRILFAVMDLPPSVLHLPLCLPQGADRGHSSQFHCQRALRLHMAEQHQPTRPTPISPILLLQDWLLQVWSHSVLLNLSLLPACTLSSLWRGEANPLPHHGDNEVIRAHDQDLAGSGAALQGRVRHAQVRRKGLGVIDQLA